MPLRDALPCSDSVKQISTFITALMADLFETSQKHWSPMELTKAEVKASTVTIINNDFSMISVQNVLNTDNWKTQQKPKIPGKETK